MEQLRGMRGFCISESKLKSEVSILCQGSGFVHTAGWGGIASHASLIFALEPAEAIIHLSEYMQSSGPEHVSTCVLLIPLRTGQ